MKICKLGSFVGFFLSQSQSKAASLLRDCGIFLFLYNLTELAEDFCWEIFAAEFYCLWVEKKNINGQERHSKLRARRRRPAAFLEIRHPF